AAQNPVPESKPARDADSAMQAEALAMAQRKAAEAAENALRLSANDRQRLQVALTSLGLDTQGIDGAFGPRSRDMIAAWQRRKNETATGFLTGQQQQALLREAAPAVSKFD